MQKTFDRIMWSIQSSPDLYKTDPSKLKRKQARLVNAAYRNLIANKEGKKFMGSSKWNKKRHIDGCRLQTVRALVKRIERYMNK